MPTTGPNPATYRVPISFDPWYRVLSRLVGLSPADAFVELAGEQVTVRMAWAFSSKFPRAAVASVSCPEMRPLSRGVHGFAGRWLVNGSGKGIVAIELNPAQRGHVLGVPVTLRELLISLQEPAEVAARLTTVT